MTDLSPDDAQAVLNAVVDGAHPAFAPIAAPMAAAALRAAADRARRGPEHWEGSCPDDYDNGWNEAVDYLTTIATKLENQ